MEEKISLQNKYRKLIKIVFQGLSDATMNKVPFFLQAEICNESLFHIRGNFYIHSVSSKESALGARRVRLEQGERVGPSTLHYGKPE